MTTQSTSPEAGTPPILIAEAEAERFNAFASELLGHIIDGEPCPDVAGDKVYDAVWTLRVYDQELAPLQDETLAGDTLDGLRQTRLRRLEGKIGSILEARELHPAGKAIDPFEGLEEILDEIRHPEMPPLKAASGVIQASIDWHGTGIPGYEDADRDVLTVNQLLHY